MHDLLLLHHVKPKLCYIAINKHGGVG